MKLLSVTVQKDKSEFSIEGIADIYTKEVSFECRLNNIPFYQTKYFEEARAFLLNAIKLNEPKQKEKPNEQHLI